MTVEFDFVRTRLRVDVFGSTAADIYLYGEASETWTGEGNTVT